MTRSTLLYTCLLISTLPWLSCQPSSGDPAAASKSDAVATTDSVTELPLAVELKLPNYDTMQWSEPNQLIHDAILDIRYATTNNFVGEQLYPCPTCWLRPAAAQALVRAADVLRAAGYRIVLFDCYRPVPIQERLWAIKPDATYVTPPAKGSMHNRGLAVDIGLADLEGVIQNMGTAFDFFGREAHQDYKGHPADIQARRDLLKSTLENAGFASIRSEWWHYSYTGVKAALSREQWPCPKLVE